MNKSEEEFSAMRKQLLALAAEYGDLIGALLGRERLVRGTLNWHQRASGKYPGITRGEQGTVVGRRVRLEHVEWLKPLLARHKAYRRTQARLRVVHTQVLALAERLRQARLYDYEPQAAAEDHLVKTAEGDGHGA